MSSTLETTATRTPDTTQRICAYDVSWETYLHISDGLNGRHVRLTYDRGTLEFMTISAEHGRLCRFFGQLVAALADEFELPLVSFGDMTCRRESAQRGLEPDECFYIGSEPLIRGKNEFDFEVDPPPDLAIEIDISRPRRDRLDVYAGLGVPEVWTFDGTGLTAFRLEDGVYEPVESSSSFAGLRMTDVLPFVHRRHGVDDRSVVREFQKWVREHVVPT